MADIDGLNALFQTLERVPRNLQRKTLRRGLARGAAMVRDEARRIVRRRTGKLAKQIRSVSSRGTGQRGVVAYKVTLTKAGFYGHFLEYGHVARGKGQKIKGGARRRANQRVLDKAEGKFVPPYPFMRPAAQKLPQALAIMQKTLAEAIGNGEVTQ